MLIYTLTPNFKKHQWHINLTFQHQIETELTLKLANWVPGSYTIRDFSRHIIEIKAQCNKKEQTLTQLSKNQWQLPSITGEWQICYTIYAYDLSVRASYLTNERAFFDGACLFLTAEEYQNQPHRIILQNIPKNWQIATTLPQISEHTFQTASYTELIDHPVELGNIEFIDFIACNIPHRIALSGHYPDFDRNRLRQDIQAICENELTLFPSPAPFNEYLFLLHLGDNIYGGLEHISSTALQADRHDLPMHGATTPTHGYTQLLGLFAHEYFHAWNIKSIKPACFIPYQLDQESYTEQLWAFEGITSYYDDLTLVRSRVISPEAYLNLLAKTLTRVQQGKGQQHQTLAQSSFSAWHKYYKQDENSPNAIVSYYQKGALMALCLDLIIRQQSQQQHSLDTVMQQLYLDWCATHQGIAEQQWQQRCQQITGLDLHDFFNNALYTTQPLPLEICLHSVGISLQWQAQPRSHGGALVEEFSSPNTTPDLGARHKQTPNGAQLTHIFSDGSAENACLCPQDIIVAINHQNCSDLTAQINQYQIGDTLTIHYLRHSILHETTLLLQATEANTAILKIENRDNMMQWLYAA